MALSAQLFYHCIFNSLAPASVSSDDLESGKELVAKGLEMYPNSAVQLYFEGKFNRLMHDLATSTKSFAQGNEAQNYFIELNHLFQYELVLNNILSQEWEKSIELLDILIKDKYYSVISFKYLSGIIYLIINNVEKAKECFSGALELFKKQPKTIDIEQYCNTMIQFIQENNYTDAEAAILEFMYLWDGIPCMDKKRLEMALALRKDNKEDGIEYKTSENEIKNDEKKDEKNNSKGSLKSSSSSINHLSKKEIEREYIYILIKGSIYRELKQYEDSEKLLQSIIDNKNLFHKKSYILPFTYFELGILYTNTGDYNKAQKNLGKIKSYKGFFMEFRFVFIINNDNNNSSGSSSSSSNNNNNNNLL